jgi:hypothetical protein
LVKGLGALTQRTGRAPRARINYTEGPPPAGITDTLKSINNRTDDFISTENGKEVLKTHVVVSANHKTMIITLSGVDDKGVAFTSIEAYDRQ